MILQGWVDISFVLNQKHFFCLISFKFEITDFMKLTSSKLLTGEVVCVNVLMSGSLVLDNYNMNLIGLNIQMS